MFPSPCLASTRHSQQKLFRLMCFQIHCGALLSPFLAQTIALSKSHSVRCAFKSFVMPFSLPALHVQDALSKSHSVWCAFINFCDAFPSPCLVVMRRSQQKPTTCGAWTGMCSSWMKAIAWRARPQSSSRTSRLFSECEEVCGTFQHAQAKNFLIFFLCYTYELSRHGTRLFQPLLLS